MQEFSKWITLVGKTISLEINISYRGILAWSGEKICENAKCSRLRASEWALGGGCLW